MYCRCPDCHATYPIIAAQLAAADGRVRCQRCGKAFGALACLFDQWPEPGETPPGRMTADHIDGSSAQSTLPLLGQASATAEHIDGETDGDGGAVDHSPGTQTSPVAWLTWGVAAAGLFSLMIVQLLQDPQARSWIGLQSDPAVSLTAQTEVPPIQLYSRDLHEHPGVDNALVLSAVLQNPHIQPQPYPLLEVSLTNPRNEIIAQRRFRPMEYLDSPAAGSGAFAANSLLPLLLEFTDPGPEATGYQLEFY